MQNYKMRLDMCIKQTLGIGEEKKERFFLLESIVMGIDADRNGMIKRYQ